mgnify:FL=1
MSIFFRNSAIYACSWIRNWSYHMCRLRCLAESGSLRYLLLLLKGARCLWILLWSHRWHLLDLILALPHIENGFFCRWLLLKTLLLKRLLWYRLWRLLLLNDFGRTCRYCWLVDGHWLWSDSCSFICFTLPHFLLHLLVVVSQSLNLAHIDNTGCLRAMAGNRRTVWFLLLRRLTSCFRSLCATWRHRCWSFLRSASICGRARRIIMCSSNTSLSSCSSTALRSNVHIDCFKFVFLIYIFKCLVTDDMLV